AVDLEDLAGEVGPRGRAEVEHGGRDLLRAPDPAERGAGLHLAHDRLVGGDVLQRRGQHRADRHRVHPYARGEDGGRESRVVGYRGLRRAVREVAATGHTADDRGDVDDRAALTRQQVGYGGAGQRVRGVDVEVERVGEVAGV